MQTGAVIIGSQSTANIARGSNVPDDRIRTPVFGETMTFGKFRVRLLPVAVNASGQIVGYYTDASNHDHRFVDIAEREVYEALDWLIEQQPAPVC